MKKFVVVALCVGAVVGSALAGDRDRDRQKVQARPQDCVSEAIGRAPYTPPDAAETEVLVYLREEEKLARDVYIAMDALWGLRIFENIQAAEQNHMDAVLKLLDKYGIPDPVGSNAVGVFTNESLQALHDQLVASGRTSLLAALEVGATIEDMDLFDLMADRGRVDNPDILQVLDHLARGSRNHLRSFYALLLANGVTYEPQYLDQATFDSIVNSPRESGGGGRADECACGGGPRRDRTRDRTH